jgi:hypothetical protein
MTLYGRYMSVVLVVAGCGVSTRPGSDDATVLDAAFDVPDTTVSDVRIDAPRFEDGAECRTSPQGSGIADCRNFFFARGLVLAAPTESFICCAGRCFIGQSCLVEDPTRARCDLAERPCNLDEVCCLLPTRRYDCRSRANPVCNPPPDGF